MTLTAIKSRDQRIEKLEKALDEALSEIGRLRKLLNEQAEIIEKQDKTIKEQSKIIKEQSRIIEEWKRGHRKRGRRTRKEGKRKESPSPPKKPGRKPGHEGAFRPPPDKVDETEHHQIEECTGCGSQTNPTGNTRQRYRTEIEPPPPPTIIEEIDHETECVACGMKKWARPQPPPSGSPVLGSSVIAIAALLRFEFKMSWEDTAKFITEYFSLKITASGLTQLFARIAKRIQPVLKEIKRMALSSAFLHLDETSWYEGGSLRWLWIVSHPELSLFHIAESRGREVARSLLTDEVDELFKGIAISDFYTVYRYMEGLYHQYCWVHLVRDARKLAEIDNGPLTEKFLISLVSIFHDGLHAQESMKDGHKHGIRIRLGKLIKDKELGKHSGIAKLQRRMDEEFHSLLTFLDVKGLPAENNQGERDLRIFVILRKISFQTRSARGSRTMADMMSVAQTSKKQGVPFGAFITDALDAYHRGQDPPSLFAQQ